MRKMREIRKKKRSRVKLLLNREFQSRMRRKLKRIIELKRKLEKKKGGGGTNRRFI